MGRRSSAFSDEDDVVVRSKRKRQKVNYAAVENNYDDLDDDLDEQEFQEESAAPAEEPEETALDEDDALIPTQEPVSAEEAPSQRSSKSHKKKYDDDDESFNEDEEEDSEEQLDDESDEYASDFAKEERRRQERQFISRDDDDEIDDDEENDYVPGRSHRKTKRPRGRPRGSGGRSVKRNKRGRPRLTRSSDYDLQDEAFNGDEGHENADNTLEQEIADLKDSDVELTPQPRSLRQRTKEVNYQIPPPLTENLDGLPEIVQQPSPSRRRGNNGAMSIRRLFPTGGPFGGGDVTSIFGKNYGGLSNTPGNLLAGGADSDSSDDEIVPVNGAHKPSIVTATPIGKPKKKDIADTDPLGVDMNVDFSSIGGLDNYINQLKEMVALPLLYPEVYQRFGITPPRGVLFHGPPGTGKTLMARALAASCSTQGKKITFFMRKGADCLSKWVGEAERQLRLLFEEAKKQQPSIIFFDEIDGLAPVRSSKQEQIHASIVSTLLALMDGMDNRGQVIVIGATNRPDAVDPALRRPGRFDREFYFPLPDIKAREEILQIHTKKWDPPLPTKFVEKVAQLTKGYGGADLRALCTEAALNSIQRRYPQIYQSNDKLKIDPSSIHVAAKDFMKALDKIIPSSARSTASGSAPLPEHLTSLLEESLEGITAKLDKLVPRMKKLTALEEAQLVDPTENDEDGGFAKMELVKRLEASRVHRPRLLITGEAGNGQQYLGAAVLNHLEGFNVQSLDLGSLFIDSTRTTENAIIQSFVEAKRHKPSIIFIPNIDIWYHTVPESAKSTLSGLLRSVSSNERILLLGVSDTPYEELDNGLKVLFGVSDANFVKLSSPDETQRLNFFETFISAIAMKPNEFLDSRQKKPLEVLEKIELAQDPEAEEENLKAFEKHDMKLKNTLKIKLSGLMDLFKNRYRKFKKPPIDDFHLIHLFEDAPAIVTSVPPLYTKEGDMIVEVSTGRKFFNMDLDIIEERLWNGFYSEPKQFLKDIEMIYLDSVTLNDRERLIKASEMYANAQVGVEEISLPEFVEQCKALRKRELKRIKEHEKKVMAERALVPIAEVVEDSETNKDVEFTDISKSEEEHGEVVDQNKNSPGEEILETKGDNNESPARVSLTDKDHFDSIEKVDEPVTPEPALEPVGSAEPTSREQQPHRVLISQLVEPSKEIPLAVALPITEPDVPFVIDTARLKRLESRLVTITEGCTVELLEQINAQLMDIVWERRGEWDRTSMLDAIEQAINVIGEEFNK